MTSDLISLSIAEIAPLVRSRQLSSVELTQAHLDRIAAIDSKLNAHLQVFPDEALARARAFDVELSAGRYRGPLHGIPIGVKDIFATAGHLTTCGSKVLLNNVTPFDATSVERLRNAGAVLLGKHALWEFATGDDVNPFTGKGPARNPWDPNRSVSGSSTGSAVAVASGMCMAALGTDTGGSVRGPAAYCGLVGMKPTFGRVSRYGVTPLSWTMDHVGTLTRSVDDNALVFRTIAGPDPKDRWCSDHELEPWGPMNGEVRGLRIGLPKRFFFDDVPASIEEAVRKAAAVFEQLGATLSEVDIPHAEFVVGAWYAIMLSDALAYHERYLKKGLRSQYTAGTQVQFDVARFIAGTDVAAAQQMRRPLIRDFDAVFQSVDVILSPLETIPPPLTEDVFGPSRETRAGRIPLIEIGAHAYCAPNLAGVPALVVPCGFSPEGLPITFQMMARHFDEATLYRAALAYEGATDWHTRRPAL
jgi:aspartyl-tRNA(Asn)/glutamyl-tRNA(Gln) amidotransferase subunit A